MICDDAEWKYLASNYPGDFLVRGNILKVMSLACMEFERINNKDESLGDYDVSIKSTKNMQFAAVEFILSKTSSMGDCSADEDAQSTKRKNLTFIYDVSSCALLEIA